MIRTLTSERKSELVEKIAKSEHEQWCSWSRSLTKTENISNERKERWKQLWIPYEQLTEKQKEQDRVWARKVLQVFKELNMDILSK